MISTEQAQHLVTGGGNVVEESGDKIGSIGQVFLDDQTGEPEWVTVRTGIFGSAESFVPLHEAEVAGDDIRVPYDKATVKGAPRISDSDGHLSESEEDTLFAHYGVTTTGSASQSGLQDDRDGLPVDAAAMRQTTDQSTAHRGDRADGAEGHDVSGPETDSAMTRSEEQLTVGTETRETGRARLRKFIVTEQVTTTVPVSREEVRLEREPITSENIGDATAGGELTSEEHEMVLHEERPVVQKETVPVERIRLAKDTIADEEQVSEEVRKEQIELDNDNDKSIPEQANDRGERRG